MSAFRRKLPLLLGIVMSLLLHAAVLFPGFMIAMNIGGPATPGVDGMMVDEADFAKPEPGAEEEEEDPLRLGIAESNASTMNWIGFDEYQEHIAALSKQEQPELRLEDGGPPGSAGAPGSVPAPAIVAQAAPSEPAKPAEPSDLPPQEPAEPQPPVEIASQPEPSPPPPPAAEPTGLEAIQRIMAELARTPQGAIPAPQQPETAPSSELPQTPDPADPRNQPPLELPPSESMQPDSSDKPAEVPPARSDSEPVPAPSAPPTTAPSPAVPPTPASPGAPGAPGESGDDNPSNNDAGLKSDRESDATSVIDAPPESWRAGKPLAAQGLEILTFKAKIPPLVLATAMPRNPLYEIQFNRRGSPSHVRLIQTSGERQVDEPLLSSLYRWRAKGKQLEQLSEKETINVRVRMILIQRGE